MTKKRETQGGKVSLKPSDMRQTIEELIASTKLPTCSESDYRSLDFHGDPGVYVITEALRQKPICGLSQRDLSQYACRLAKGRIEGHPSILSLSKDYATYRKLRVSLPLSTRKRCNDLLQRSASIYYPLVKASTHIWFMSIEDKRTTFGLLSDCGLPSYFLYPFIADALSEISSLGEMASDLRDEFIQVDVCLAGYSEVLKKTLLNINYE